MAFHGVKTTRAASSAGISIIQAASGVTIAFGTAPAHTVGGGAHQIIKANNYREAVAALGYSDNWKNYTLCEVMYSHFMLYGVAPLFLVNVLDPEMHKKSVSGEAIEVTDGVVVLSLEAVASTITVDSYALDTDYTVAYTDGKCVLEAVDGGGFPSTGTITVSYTAVDPTAVTANDIIGSKDVDTGRRTGLELIEICMPKYGTVPDIVIAPGFSHKPEVASALAAKCDISGVFKAKALVDTDCESVTKLSDVPTWKKTNGITDERQIVCWPMASYEGKRYHMSTQLSGLMGMVDTDNDGIPSRSPSNKAIAVDSTVLANGSEVLLELSEANYLNANGIVTALNFTGNFVSWGNYTACYPEVRSSENSFIAVSRMLDWIGNSLAIAYWTYIDMPIQNSLVERVADTANMWINGLTKAGHLVGGRAEVKAEENPREDVEAGKLKIHLYAAPSSPAQEIEWIVEYDASYLAKLFS